MKVDIFNTNKKYNIIYADPPWQYNDKMKMKGVHGMIRGAESFYSTMNLQSIEDLGSVIQDISDKDCILFMWITMPMLPNVSNVMRKWGFKYKTCGYCWIKKTKNGKIHLGMGHYTRGNAELCLIGIKGKKMKFKTRSQSQIIESEIKKHSEKPSIVRDKIVELVGDLPRIELFARQYADGWDCWGDEV